MDLFWDAQGWQTRLVVLFGGGIALVAMIRLMKVAYYLYRWVPNLMRNDLSAGASEAQRLSGFALASRNFSKNLAKIDGSSAEKIRDILRESDVRFRYLWDSCLRNVRSSMRASTLLILLSVLAVACQANDALRLEAGKMDASTYLLWEFFLSAAWLRVGFTVSAMLYLASSYYERALSRRMAEWEHFSARVRPASVDHG